MSQSLNLVGSNNEFAHNPVPVSDVDEDIEVSRSVHQHGPGNVPRESLPDSSSGASLHNGVQQLKPGTEADTQGVSTAVPTMHNTTAGNPQTNPIPLGNGEPTNSDKWQDSWWPEIACCAFAAALLIAACGVLIAADNKPLSWWPWNWQISSALALITALMEAALIYSITSCLGQLSWVWFTKDRVEPQSTLICFDQISHAFTPLGATTFIVRSPARWSWSFVGSATVLLLLGTGLFTQNVVTQQLGPHQFPDDGNVVYVAQNYDVFSVNSSSNNTNDKVMTPLMLSSILTGLSAPIVHSMTSDRDTENLSFRNGLFVCSAENCTFGIYSTLNVCSACVNSTSSIDLRDDIYSLSNGSLTLSTNAGLANMTSDTLYPTSSGFANFDLGPLVLHYQAMARRTTNETPIAAECVAFWCVTTHKADVTSNILGESYLAIIDDGLATSDDLFSGNATFTNSSLLARTQYGQQNNVTIVPPTSYQNSTLRTDIPFTISADAQQALQRTFMTGISGSGPLFHGSVEMTGNSSRSSSLTAHLIFGSEDPFAQEGGEETLPDLYPQLTNPFTNMTHHMGYALRLTYDSSGYGLTWGDTIIDAPHIHIRWGWIAYPATIVLLVTLFVARTWHMSNGHKRWKSSNLPILIHGLKDPQLAQFLITPADLRNDAKRRSARLKGNENGQLPVWSTTDQ